MRTLLAIAVVISVVGQANAAPANPESIETLFVVMKTEATIEFLYDKMDQITRRSIQQATGGKPITPEQRQTLDKLRTNVAALVRKELSWDTLRPQYVQLYSETFDQEEIDSLVAFYRSTAGQAFVAKMPTLLQKTMTIAQSQMLTLLPKVKMATEQALAEAKLAK